MEAVLMDLLWAALVYTALTGAQVFLRHLKFVQRSKYSVNLLFLLATANLFVAHHLGELHAGIELGLQAAFFCLGSYVLIRLLDLLIFDVIVKYRTQRQVPVVLRDIVRWLLSALAVFLILRTLFPGLNLSVLAFSSIVVGYILGNASQDTLGNLIAGLALNTERPFLIGDWVQLGEHSGRVVDMTWRATRLKTKESDHIIIPNSTIARETITNYSRPTLSHGFKVSIGVNYGVPPNKVREVIMQVCAEVPEVLKDPAPQVWTWEYDDFSINYILKFFIRDFQRLEPIKSRIFDLIWYHFKREGIVIPFPIRDVRTRNSIRAEAEELRKGALTEYRQLLNRIDIFDPLSEEEHDWVAGHLVEEIYTTGEVLVRQGEPGASFYVVLSGSVNVSVNDTGRTIELAKLHHGEFFGEMSLLTGADRNATVTALEDTRALVLSNTVFKELLERNEGLDEKFAQELAARSERQEEAIRATPIAGGRPEPAPSRTDLLRRIRGFFGLGG